MSLGVKHQASRSVTLYSALLRCYYANDRNYSTQPVRPAMILHTKWLMIPAHATRLRQSPRTISHNYQTKFKFVRYIYIYIRSNVHHLCAAQYVSYFLLSCSSLAGQVAHMFQPPHPDMPLPLIHSQLRDNKATSFSYHRGGLNLIMQGCTPGGFTNEEPALSAVWHDKQAVKAPSAHTTANYIISRRHSNGDGVSRRGGYTERGRWASHVVTA